MRSVAALLLLVSLLPAAEIKVGHTAPPLTLDHILQASPGAEADWPVLDETGLEGRYDYELRWDIRNPISVLDYVRDELGLELRPQVREMKHLIVRSIERSKTW